MTLTPDQEKLFRRAWRAYYRLQLRHERKALVSLIRFLALVSMLGWLGVSSIVFREQEIPLWYTLLAAGFAATLFIGANPLLKLLWSRRAPRSLVKAETNRLLHELPQLNKHEQEMLCELCDALQDYHVPEIRRLTSRAMYMPLLGNWSFIHYLHELFARLR